MALSEKSRSTIYQTFEGLVGSEATEEMLSYFPARDVEEPVTKEHLDRRIAEVRTDVARLQGDMHRELNQLFLKTAGVVTVAVTVLSFTT